jgi:sugar/nucleoside kinase (ribokinase family)
MAEKYKLCCIGHITKDKIVTPRTTVYSAGGTAFYFSHAVQKLNFKNYLLCTAVGKNEMAAAEDLIVQGIETKLIPCEDSVFFENIYGENQDDRTQRVLAKAAPFTLESIRDIHAKIIHLGALLADDFPENALEELAGHGALSVDVQGFLRRVGDDGSVLPCDWQEKDKILKSVHFLKANEHELRTLTGISSVKEAVRKIYNWGVKEVIATLGSEGSVVYDGTNLHRIPAFIPKEAADATGCGDTYMAGYLVKRLEGASIEEAGRYGAAMATLKIEHTGPFDGTLSDIGQCMKCYKTLLPGM